MSDTHDELSQQPIMGSTPEEWLGSPDAVQRFRATLDRALERLAVEGASVRAERDGLRLELEGVRAELELARADLAERERFASAVRELGEIVRHLNVPVELLVQPIEPPAVPLTQPVPAITALEPEVPSEPEPPTRPKRRRRHWLKRTLTVIGGIIVAVVVLIVLAVSLGPKVAPYDTYVVQSGSMEPTFDTGDLIVLDEVDGSEIKKGDILTFERPDKPDTLVTHRVVGIETTAEGRQFQTKGDANNFPDGWRVPASGTQWKYKFRVSELGYVFDYLSKPLARVALLAVPVVLLGLLWLGDIKKRRR